MHEGGAGWCQGMQPTTHTHTPSQLPTWSLVCAPPVPMQYNLPPSTHCWYARLTLRRMRAASVTLSPVVVDAAMRSASRGANSGLFNALLQAASGMLLTATPAASSTAAKRRRVSPCSANSRRS